MQRQKRHEKIICERQRRGSKNKYHEYRHKKGTAINDDFYDDFEEEDVTMVAPKIIEPMSRPYKRFYMEKEFNDFTTPIRGFIRKNVGRVWDEVFSEFAEQYDQRSVLTKHLYLHLKQHVCTKVKDINGVLTVCSSYRVIPLIKSHEDYYVDPRDGVLKYNEHYVGWKALRRQYQENNEAKRVKTIRVVDRFHEYHLINGTWFFINFIECPGKNVQVKHTSMYNNRIICYTAIEYPPKFDIIKKEVVDGKRYAASKRTASKKEIRDYQLNEFPTEERLVA